MNTVLGYDPVGWGVPYGNLVSTDTAKPLMESAVHALVILLDYGNPLLPPGASPDPAQHQLPYVLPNDVDSQGFNVYRKILGSIEAPDQLNFIFRGFLRLLKNIPQAESSYLPYSITRVTIEQELLVLLWKCLEEIPKFMPYVLRQCDVTELLVPICYFMLEGRKDPAKVGLMYLCTFTLLKLSGERSFGVALNKPYALRLPVDVPLFVGNHADLLVVVLHKMIVSGLDKLSALYNCFLTIICNISPYCKSLCTISSVKLVNLLQLFTSPRFLYASEGNHIYVAMLLETFNNIVQYQYEGNANLVYAIVRRREVFEGLAALTLSSAIESAAEACGGGKPSSSSSASASSSASSSSGAAGAAGAAGAKGKAGGTNGKAQKPPSEAAPSSSAPTPAVSTKPMQRRPGEDQDEEIAPSSSASASGAEAGNGGAGGAGAGAGAGGRFVPTQAWLDQVKAELPLNTIVRLLRHLVPQILELTAKVRSFFFSPSSSLLLYPRSFLLKP